MIVLGYLPLQDVAHELEIREIGIAGIGARRGDGEQQRLRPGAHAGLEDIEDLVRLPGMPLVTDAARRVETVFVLRVFRQGLERAGVIRVFHLTAVDPDKLPVVAALQELLAGLKAYLRLLLVHGSGIDLRSGLPVGHETI